MLQYFKNRDQVESRRSDFALEISQPAGENPVSFLTTDVDGLLVELDSGCGEPGPLRQIKKAARSAADVQYAPQQRGLPSEWNRRWTRRPGRTTGKRAAGLC